MAEERVYEVFARKSHDDPLTHVGYVNAPTNDLARVYAWTVYDEESWIEMCVAPREAFIAVNRDDEELSVKGN